MPWNCVKLQKKEHKISLIFFLPFTSIKNVWTFSPFMHLGNRSVGSFKMCVCNFFYSLNFSCVSVWFLFFWCHSFSCLIEVMWCDAMSMWLNEKCHGSFFVVLVFRNLNISWREREKEQNPIKPTNWFVLMILTSLGILCLFCVGRQFFDHLFFNRPKRKKKRYVIFNDGCDNHTHTHT